MRSSLLTVVSAGKHVVTTNKGPIAHQYDDLQRIRGPGERKTINRVHLSFEGQPHCAWRRDAQRGMILDRLNG